MATTYRPGYQRNSGMRPINLRVFERRYFLRSRLQTQCVAVLLVYTLSDNFFRNYLSRKDSAIAAAILCLLQILISATILRSDSPSKPAWEQKRNIWMRASGALLLFLSYCAFFHPFSGLFSTLFSMRA